MPIRCPRCSTPPPFDPFLCTACGEHLLTYLDEPLGPGSGVGVRPMGTMTVPRADGPTEVELVGHQQPPPPVPPSDNTGPFILKGLFGLFVAMILFSIETMSGLLYLPILALMLWRWPRARLIPSFLALAGLAAGVLLVVAFIDEIDLTSRIDPTPEPDFAATSTALVIEGTPTLSPAALTATATVVAGQNQVKISRARARWLRGDNATAQAELNDVLTLIPGLPEALNLRAMVRIAAGDHEGAAADAERAVDAQPSNRAYVDTRGYALLKLGRYEAAASDYDRVLSSPRPERYVGAYLGRGVARTAQGRLVEARADLETGLRLLPDADPDPQLADLEILARRALDPLAPRPGAGSPSPAASPGVQVTPGPMASPAASPAALRPERPGSAAIPSLRSGQALAAPVRSGQDGRAPRGVDGSVISSTSPQACLDGTAVNCPLCAYESQYAAMRCPGCRTVFDSDALETLWHLVYLRDRLQGWRTEGVLSPEAAEAALAAAEREIAALQSRLVPMAPPVAAAAGVMPVAPAQPVGPVAAGAPDLAHADVEAAEPVGAGVAVGVGVPAAAHLDGVGVPPGDAAALADEIGDAVADAEAATAPGPSFAWRNVGTYLLSERTLHGLLGLGALLILASGVVISTLNPTRLGPLPHLGAVIATTLLFFVAGYVVRQRLRLTIAGATLLGIAGAFVPMTIWTLGQERLLNWETGAIWLVSSLVSLPLYLAVHRLLRDRTFAVLAALAGGSEVLAVLNWLGVPLEWGLAGLLLLAIGYVRLAWRLRVSGEALAWALLRAAQVAVPLLLALLLFARFGSDAWLAAFGRPLGGWGRYAIVVGWWLGMLFYVQRARLFRGRWDGYVVAWLLPVAYILTLGLIPGDGAWGGFCFGALALGYLLVGYVRVVRAASETFAPSYLRLARSPYFQVCAVLVVVACFWPLQNALSRIATLYLLAGLLVLATALLRLRVPAWIGVVLLVVAYQLTLDYRDEFTHDVLSLAWAVLAAVLLAAGEVVVRWFGEPGDDAPNPRTWRAAWRSRLGAPLFAAGYLVCGISLLFGLTEYYWHTPVQASVRRLGEFPIYGFVVLLATLTASSIARRTGLFLYVVPWLALIPLTSSAAILFDRLGWPLREPEVARLLAGTSAAWLIIAWLADRGDGRYARPLYLAGYLLLPGAMLLSLLDRMASLQVVGFGIVVYVVSACLTHVGRLPSWERLVERLCGSGTSAVAGAVRSLWVYLAVWLTPAWAMILTSLWAPPISTYALVLSGLALVYPALGLWIRRVRLEYRWPWYLGGYALSAIAPLVAMTDTTLRPVVLGLSIALYVASAVVGRRSAWLYPVAVLGPVLLWLALGPLDAFERWYGIGLVVLALAYGGIGIRLHPLGADPSAPRPSRYPLRGPIGSYAVPFLTVGYVLSALGLARAANQEASLATAAFGLGAVLFAASAVVFRQSVFGWATAGLTLVTYVIGLTLTPLDPIYRGLALLPAGVMALLVAEALRRRIEGKLQPPALEQPSPPYHGAPQSPRPQPSPSGRGSWASGYAWSLPWYVVVCGLAVAVPFIPTFGVPFDPTASRQAWTLGVWGSALLFGMMTAALRRPAWLYPTLVYGTYAYFVTGFLATPPLVPSAAFATLALPTWIFLGLAYAIERRWPGIPLPQPLRGANIGYADVLSLARERGESPKAGDTPDDAAEAASDGGDAGNADERDDPARERLREAVRVGRGSLTGWAGPFHVMGWLTLVLACLGSLPFAEYGLPATLATGVLLVGLALLRVQPGYAWMSVAVLTLAGHNALRLAEVAGHLQPIYWAGASVVAVVLSLWLPSGGHPRLALWKLPLSIGSGLMAVGAVVAALLVEVTLLTKDALQALALTLAIVGLTAIGHAYGRRERYLVYVGIGLLDIGLVLELLAYEVGQPQAFALPVGAYLLVVAYLEWRRGSGRLVKRLLESGALIVLLGVSLLQAVGFMGAGYDRYVYATFLLLESAGLLALGAVLRWRYTFFAGTLVLVVDVGILLVDPLKALNTWYLVALIGLVLIGAVIWIERQRQKIPFWLEDLRVRLERWD